MMQNPYSMYGKPPMPAGFGMPPAAPQPAMPGMGGILGGMQPQPNQGMGGILGGYQHSQPYLPYGPAGQAPAAPGAAPFSQNAAPVRWMDGGPLPPAAGGAGFDPKMLLENAPWFQNLFNNGGSGGGGAE